MAAFLALLAVAAGVAAAELTRVEHPAKNDGSLSLLVVGDWGRKGNYNQSRVAEQVPPIFRLISFEFDPLVRVRILIGQPGEGKEEEEWRRGNETVW